MKSQRITIAASVIALVAFGLADPEALSNGAVLVHEIADAQAEQIRDSQSRVDADGKQQQVAEAALAFEQVFDVRDLFGCADGFHIVHTNGAILVDTLSVATK